MKTLDEATKIFMTDGKEDLPGHAEYMQKTYEPVFRQSMESDRLKALAKMMHGELLKAQAGAFNDNGLGPNQLMDPEAPPSQETIQKCAEAAHTEGVSAIFSAVASGIMIGLEMSGVDVKSLPMPIELRVETPSIDDLDKLFALDSGEEKKAE